jgi:hypothetical protein
MSHFLFLLWSAPLTFLSPLSAVAVGQICSAGNRPIAQAAMTARLGRNSLVLAASADAGASDTSTICNTIPIKLCSGQAYKLTVPAGRSAYHWYRNGVIIASATTNALTVTQAGSYSISADNMGSNCPDISTCPVVFTMDSLPIFRIRAIQATCSGNAIQANGRLVITGFNKTHSYQYSAGPAFNSAASLSGTAKSIPSNGVLTSALVSPTTRAAYSVRVYNQSGCYVDQTALLLPTVCGCPTNDCVPYMIKKTRTPRHIGDPIR